MIGSGFRPQNRDENPSRSLSSAWVFTIVMAKQSSAGIPPLTAISAHISKGAGVDILQLR